MPTTVFAALDRRAMAGGLLLILAFVASWAGAFFLLGPYAFERVLFLQLVLVSGAAVFLFLLHRPQWGVALMLFGALLVARRLGTGTETGLNGAVLIVPVMVGVWMVRRFFRREDYSIAFSRSIPPLFVFMGVVVLSMIVGQYPWFSVPAAPIHVQFAQLGIFLFSGLILLIAAQYLQETAWLRRIVWIFFLIGTLHLMVRLVPGMDGQTRGLLPLVIHSGSMFWTWLVALSFGQFVLNRDLNPLARMATGGIALTAVGVTLVQTQDWVSGWFPPLVAMGVILLLRFPRTVLLSGPIIALVTLAVFINLVTDFVTVGDNLYSLETRGAAIQSLLPILSANPILGLGPANYHSYTPLYPILGWYVNYSSHNNYLDLIAQTGLLGLACFFWFAWAIGRTGWNLRGQAGNGFESGYVYGVLGGLVASMAAAALGDWVIPFVYNTGFEGFRTSILFWLFLGGLVALDQRRRHSS